MVREVRETMHKLLIIKSKQRRERFGQGIKVRSGCCCSVFTPTVCNPAQGHYRHMFGRAGRLRKPSAIVTQSLALRCNKSLNHNSFTAYHGLVWVLVRRSGYYPFADLLLRELFIKLIRAVPTPKPHPGLDIWNQKGPF